MLAHSWAILQELGATTIPEGSYADRIRTAIAVTRPWLIFNKSKMVKRNEGRQRPQGVSASSPAHVRKPVEVRKSHTADPRTHSWQITDQKLWGNTMTFEFRPEPQEMIVALAIAHPEHIRQVSSRHSIGGGNDLTLMISLAGMAVPAISEVVLPLI